MHAFYNMRRQNLLAAEPNAAHRALAHLEADLAERGGNLFLCTQNIDDLHERAGSQRVVHMHGELLKARCTACGETMPWREGLKRRGPLPSCRHSGGLRPHVVWFGEMPLEMDAIYDALLAADLFVAIGTSGSVYPAAGFVTEARGHGIRTCEINLEPSDNARQFDEATVRTGKRGRPDLGRAGAHDVTHAVVSTGYGASKPISPILSTPRTNTDSKGLGSLTWRLPAVHLRPPVDDAKAHGHSA